MRLVARLAALALLAIIVPAAARAQAPDTVLLDGKIITLDARSTVAEALAVRDVNIGLHIGSGTDAHRVMSYNPMVSLEWMIDGRTVAGTATRDADETPSREEALRLYTQGSAWFTHDDARRGSLDVGHLADLAVLTRDFVTVPAGEIGGIESLLTMVGGRIVYAAGPFAAQEERPAP
jgi:predicted amidohydrolase YtcJ